ncbi:hypothetical protein M8818_001093 [Zalaria obscura]|uniref:Uncharacterized protein n=1 Tax=Zalaria obscura TaxID=2024903 RepID=A0ACC3SLS3_9PEZI
MSVVKSEEDQSHLQRAQISLRTMLASMYILPLSAIRSDGRPAVRVCNGRERNQVWWSFCLQAVGGGFKGTGEKQPNTHNERELSHAVFESLSLTQRAVRTTQPAAYAAGPCQRGGSGSPKVGTD